MEGEQPMRFERLTFRAVAERAISEPKAAELLGMPVHELNQRMEEPPTLELKAPARGCIGCRCWSPTPLFSSISNGGRC